MCFFRRKSKRKAAAAAAAAQAATAAVPDSSASEPPADAGEPPSRDERINAASAAIVDGSAAGLALAPVEQSTAVLIAEKPAETADASDLAADAPVGRETPLADDSAVVPSSVDMAPPRQAVVPGAPRDEVWGQDGADEKSAAVLSQLIESVTMPAPSDAVSSEDELSTAVGLLRDERPAAGSAGDVGGAEPVEQRAPDDNRALDAVVGAGGVPESPAGEQPSVAHPAGEGAAGEDTADPGAGADELKEAEARGGEGVNDVVATATLATATDGALGPRSGSESELSGDSAGTIGTRHESDLRADARDEASPGLEGSQPEEQSALQVADDELSPEQDGTSPAEHSDGPSTKREAETQAEPPHDPDQMDELPSTRPIPADAIKRASEALDAAVNAAPAVIGHPADVDDEEEVAVVDAEFTHSADETGLEAKPDDVASDYSVRVTDPIPVQSLSAPGVSRETAGPAQTAHGTQQPTGGPHGGDDERRSALIATVPAVDDTTPVAAELAMDARRRIELQGRRFPRPPKTRIITVANQKGGVGKTTTTVNIAAGLAQSGLNVLVIDNDPQGNASTALGIEHRAGTPSVYEILIEGESLASTVQQCPDIPNLWGVPATIDLSGSEIELVSLVSRETRLRKAIAKYLDDRIAAGEERIDYVLIDCPPSLGLLTVNAFVAGREVFIPIQCEYYALEGLSQLLKTIDLIRSHLNPELRVSSILLTMYDGRTNLAQQVAGEVRSHFPAETFKTTIPRSVRISEAPSYGQTVMTYDATSTGALAYLQASRELAERGQGGSSPRRAMKAEAVGAQD
ncbi:AAA family ATPase [Promicromonospora sp. NPDC050880]|uniref:AAA family ATPase n=1 Tax=Promicromonospora sp. NPDC050880 TaxID=3364406 RepID=UPI0037A6CF7D